MLAPPSPQVLFVRNAIYYCRHYYRHVRRYEGRVAEARIAARRKLIDWSCRSSALVAAPSRAMLDMLLEWDVVDESKTRVVYHGFDRERFLSMAGSFDEATAVKLARRGDEKIIFYPTLYGRNKNIDALVEAVAILRNRGRSIRLVLPCNVDANVNAYQQRTSVLIAERGMGDFATILGPQPYNVMPLLYRAADVVAWPTFTESFGHPLLEAMACRRPIVASDIPVNREIAGGAALYFETFDAGDFADKIEAALDSTTAEGLTAEGERRLADFSWDAHAREFAGIFRLLGDSTE
jgi:glycosyltransferase involved in cell wall biosynthesis